MSSLPILIALTAALTWYGVCWLVNRLTRPTTAPTASNPGRDAITTATAPRPYPTGRHRAPGGAL